MMTAQVPTPIARWKPNGHPRGCHLQCVMWKVEWRSTSNQVRTGLATIARQPRRGKWQAPMNHDICWSDSMSSVCAPYLQTGFPMFEDFFKQWKISKTTWIPDVFFIKAYFPLILQSLRTSSRLSLLNSYLGFTPEKLKHLTDRHHFLKCFLFPYKNQIRPAAKRTICSSFPSLVTNTFNKQCGLGWNVLVVSPRVTLHYHYWLLGPIVVHECFILVMRGFLRLSLSQPLLAVEPQPQCFFPHSHWNLGTICLRLRIYHMCYPSVLWVKIIICIWDPFLKFKPIELANTTFETPC